MKIAIFHNYMDNIGGAEIVTLTLAKELNATIYTTNINLEKIEKMGFKNIKIKSIGRVPINAPFKQQLSFLKFRNLSLKNKYDLYIISGDWAMSGSINNKPNLWYAHSPLNELWEFKDYIKSKLPFYQRPIYELWAKFNRTLNISYLKHITRILANSQNTKNRIKKYYNKEAKIINPPTTTKNYNNSKNKNYWISVNRLFENKRIDLQIKAFKKLPDENLIIVGSYEKAKHFQKYANHIKKIKPKNVQIVSWISDDELKELYSNAKGLIATARDEDFGMSPIEAMASGKPVIAANEGGYKETITKDTGILIDHIDESKIVESIKEINKNLEKDPEFYKENSQKRARQFDTKIFIEKIKEEIKCLNQN